MIKFLLVLSLIFALIFGSACAEVVQPNDDFWYLDEANVLSDATEGEIFFANQRLYDACGAEIVVVAVDSTAGMAIDDYAYTLFNDWEIGGNTYRGLLLLLSIADDNYYAMPGTALTVYFDSATVDDMLVEHLESDFAAKNYDAGVRKFFEAAYEKVVDDFNLNLSIDDAVQDYNAFIAENSAVQSGGPDKLLVEWKGETVAKVSVWPVIILLILLLIVTSRFRRKHHAHETTYVHTPGRSRSGSMLTGFILGRMMHTHRHPPMRPMGRPPMSGFHGPAGRPGGNPFGSVNRSSGMNRSSDGFGGASRSSAGRSFSGGFGGASRSGGASRGPSTRGGGAGRFSRR